MARNTPVIYIRVRPEGATSAVRIDPTTRILSLKYLERDHGADKLTIEVDNYDLRNFDDPVFRQGNILEARWGYPESLSPMHECVIRKVTGFQTLSVEAHGLTVLMDRQTRARTWENMTRAEVARAILVEHGWSSDQIHVEDTGVRLTTVHQTRMTDARFLARLAHQEGFQFFSDFDGVHFHRRAVGSPPRRTFTYFIDRVGEILDINVENDVTAQPGRVRAVGRDTMAGSDIDVTTDNSTESDRAILAEILEIIDPETGRASWSERTAVEDVVPTSANTTADAERTTAAHFRRAQQTAVRLSVSCIGDPLVGKGMVVQINGISRRLSGRYYLHEVEHSVSAGDYTMLMKARTDGTNGHGASATEGVPTPEEAAASGARAPDLDNGHSDRNGEALEARQVIDPETGRAHTTWVDRSRGGPGTEGSENAR